jgi:hypothetical protein
VQAAADARAQIAAQEQAAHDKALAQIAEQKAARQDAAQSALSLAADLATAISTIAEQQAEKAGATEEELARIRKRAALFAGGVSVAQAVLTALASAPPPVNFVNAAAVGAVGAVQLGAIAGATYHRGGIAGDEVGAKLQQGEGILTKAAVRDMGGPDAVRRANSRQPATGSGETRVVFQLGTKTLQSQLVTSSNAPGPHRRILDSGRPWRRGAR